MSKHGPTDPTILRDKLVIDYAQRRISRRDFMRRATAIGVSVGAATRIADILAAPAPARSAPRASNQDAVTLTFIKGPHHADEVRIQEELIEEFEAAHPDIRVNFQLYNWATMDAELTAGYASDSPPDIAYLVDLVYPKFAAAGQLADLTPQVSDPSYADEVDAIEEFGWNLATFDGQTVGVPALGALYCIFYNKDLFDAAGISDFPQTQDELLDVAQQLTGDGVYGFEFRDAVGDFAFWDWFPYIHNEDADILTPDLTEQNLLPNAVAPTQFLSDLRSEYQVTPETGAYDWEGKRALFQAGRIGILHDETPFIITLQDQDPGFEWDIAMAPEGSTGRQTVMGNFGFACIAENSPHKEEAWEFVKWWTSADIIRRFAEQVSLQIVRKDTEGIYGDNEMLQKVQSEFVPRVQGVQTHVNYLQMLQNLWPEIEMAYRGQQSAEEAITNAAAAINELAAAE